MCVLCVSKMIHTNKVRTVLTISPSVKARWITVHSLIHGLSNFRETFFIVFPPPNVTMNASRSCPGDATRQGNNHHPSDNFTFLSLSLYFLL